MHAEKSAWFPFALEAVGLTALSSTANVIDMETPGATRSAVVLRNVLRALETLDVDVAQIRRNVGISHELTDDVDAWLPITLHNQVWNEAERLSHNPLIGLVAAARLSNDLHPVLLGAVHRSATLGDAIVRMARLGRLLGAGFDAFIEIHGETTTIRLPPLDGPPLCLQAVLCQLAVYGLIGRNLTQRVLHAREVHLMHERPECADKIATLMRAPIVFGAKQNALVMRSEDLHLPVVGSDAEQLHELEERARTMLRTLPDRSTMTLVVRGLLASGVGGDSVEQLADRLCMTARTLARKLAAEGSSYQQLRDELRELRAKECLRDTDLGTTEIGLALGFSDGTAFTRAFKRWTGLTPGAYRRAHRGSVSPQMPSRTQEPAKIRAA